MGRPKNDTWEVIVYMSGGWWRSEVRHATRDDACATALYLKSECSIDDFGCYVRTTWELGMAGLPEGPPR